ncbi:MAG: DUF3068 domain-containing protein [Chloroflexi bacterium]|nr:DUF3068 domain-containing protein [Chloroflexota bacterium]
MSRKGLGAILLILGLVLVVGGLVVMLVIVPGMKQWPEDVDTIRTYSGTMPVLLNPQNFEFLRDLEVDIQRHVRTEETDGEVALVSEAQLLETGGQPLQQVFKQYAIDRKTMLVTDEYPEEWATRDGFWPREGLVIGWPIDSEAEDYPGWSDDYRATVTLVYEGEEEHARSEMDTYKYTASSGPQPIAPEAVEQMGLPPALPADQLMGLIEQADLSPMVAQMLPSLLERLEGDTVPLQYYYEYEAEYWVEPQTGVLIDTTKHELRKVGLAPEVTEGSPLAALPEDQQANLRVPVFELTYTATDESVQDAKDDAQENIDRLNLYGTYLPIAAIVVGAVLALLGLLFAVRS